MTQEFTKKDRDFIIKIAKECDALKKRVKTLEDGKKQSTKSEAKNMHTPDTFVSKPSKGGITKTQFKVFNNDSAIDVEFSTNPPSIMEQRELVTSLYKTLYELCDDNGISTLTVTIKPE